MTRRRRCLTFRSLHTAIFDEIERQGALASGIDVGRLTEAVLKAQGAVPIRLLRVEPPNPRCANGACDG